ncbi:MAG: DUF2520 domain-containing protein [Actinomycetota bacterium]|nr:DUF2520 domain-containing protein [Actinomycetota bacterium]
MKQPASRPESLPPTLRDKAVVVLGSGKVGSAVGMLLREAGLAIAAVTTRHLATAEHAASQMGSEAGIDNAAAAAKGDIVLVTTNDDSIARVVAEVAEAGGFHPDQLVVHMSGALPLSVLAPAAEAGAAIGCAHPLQSFATAEDASRTIRGSFFGITPGSGALEALEALVGVLGGHAVTIDDEDKALYHAAAVMASNYLVAVEDMAVHLLVSAGFDEASALRALQPLVSGTADNISVLGPTSALTGPIVRGDVDTVRGHVEVLRGLSGGELELYRALGRHTLEIARRRGTLDAETLEALREVLAEERGSGS